MCALSACSAVLAIILVSLLGARGMSDRIRCEHVIDKSQYARNGISFLAVQWRGNVDLCGNEGRIDRQAQT